MRAKMIVMSALFVFQVNHAALSQEPGVEEHLITVLNDFITDAINLTWVDSTGRVLPFNAATQENLYIMERTNEGVTRIPDGIGGLREIPNTFYRSVDVRFGDESRDSGELEIRGEKVIRLPQLKRIQLEIDYDVIVDRIEDAENVELFVEVMERAESRLNEWVSVGVVRQDTRIREAQ